MKTHAELKLPPASHTFHKSWEQCPRKSWHSYIARDIEREDSTALAWGRTVHAAMERHIGQGEPLPDELQHYAHLYAFPPGYTVHVELKLGITGCNEPCEFFADDVFARGVLDTVLMPDERPDMAMLIDHKTNKSIREEPDELELHAVLLKAHYPRLRTIKGWYNWLTFNRMGCVHDLSDTAKTFQRLLRTQQRIKHAFDLGAEAFPPKQGPLCPWCPVKHCEFHP